MKTDPAAAKHLSDLAWLRRARDRIDCDDAEPLNVEALARAAHMSAGHFSRRFKASFGESPHQVRVGLTWSLDDHAFSTREPLRENAPSLRGVLLWS